MKSLNEKIKEAKEIYETKYVIRFISMQKLNKQIELLRRVFILSGLEDVIITMGSGNLYLIFKSPKEAHECYRTLLEGDVIKQDFIIDLI